MHLYMVTKNQEDHGMIVIGHCHPSALGRAVKSAQHAHRARSAEQRSRTNLFPKKQTQSWAYYNSRARLWLLPAEEQAQSRVRTTPVLHGEKEMFVLEAEDGRRLCCGEDQMASGCAAARLSPR